MKNSKVQIGDTIEVKEEYRSHLEALQEREQNAHVLMQSCGAMKREASMKLWDFVHNVYPELKDFAMTYKSDDKEHPVILITGRKHD